MSPVSVVIITHNEEKNIERTIRSVLPLTDDIIIIDSFSTDATETICSRYPLRFIKHSWEGYAAQKNFGIAQATYTWILSIDADEVVSAELLASIQKIMSSPLQDAYSISFRTYYCGTLVRFGGWNPQWHVRLFDKTKISWVALDVHEILSIKPQHRIGKLTGYIDHYSYDTVETHKQKIDIYTNLFAERMYKAGKKSSALKLLFSPAFLFFKEYLLKFGVLDGGLGFRLARTNAQYTYLKYYKLLKKYRTHENS